MDYTELSTAVLSWLNRSNFPLLEAEVPLFFELAQNRIDRDPDFKMLETMEVATVQTATPTIPVGFSKAISFNIPSLNGHEINGAPLKDVQVRRGNGNTGVPLLVAPVGTDFYFGPTPNADYAVEVVYIQTLTPISPSNATNVLSNKHPELILFATLMEACLWLKDDQRAALWEGRYRDTLSSINKHEEAKRYEGGSLQVRTKNSTGFETVRLN